MTDDELFVCPSPRWPHNHDDRHICASTPDYSTPMLDAHGRRVYPMTILLYRCDGCGAALANVDNSGGRWGRYIIHEEPW